MNWESITQASLAIQIHLLTAVAALLFGLFMWVRPKGTAAHKMMGRGFVVLMLVTAFSALFIRHINNGQFSIIHIFVPITFLGAYQAITRIKRRDVKGHKNAVKGMFFGALLIPGMVAFMPGRTVWTLFFGP